MVDSQDSDSDMLNLAGENKIFDLSKSRLFWKTYFGKRFFFSFIKAI